MLEEDSDIPLASGITVNKFKGIESLKSSSVERPIFLLFPADRGGELVRCAQLRAQNQVYIRCLGWESENWPEMIIISHNRNVQGAQLGSPLTLVRSTLRLCRSQCHGVKISESRTSLFLLPQRANNGKGDSYNFKIE